MSLLFANEFAYFISSEKFFNELVEINNGLPKINPSLFKIYAPYVPKNTEKRKSKSLKGRKQIEVPSKFAVWQEEIEFVQKTYSKAIGDLKTQGLLSDNVDEVSVNTVALEISEQIYEESGKDAVENASGRNIGPATIRTIKNSKYIFPKNSIFYSKDISDIETTLKDQKFDLILLDPPWWNKYIRRKRKQCPHAYNMMYNSDLKSIPIENMLNDEGIVVVWCTNSPQHLDALIKDIFVQWGVHYVAKWYWLKVTVHGEPVCNFSQPPGKQPYEQIIFGYKNPTKTKLLPRDKKLVISIPSAIHSNKPPLAALLQPLLPPEANCLEVFARNLLPNWTSYGNEVLRLQHESLYIFE